MELEAKRLRLRQRVLLVGIITCNALFVGRTLVRDGHERYLSAPATYVFAATSFTAVIVAARDHRRLRALEKEIRNS